LSNAIPEKDKISDAFFAEIIGYLILQGFVILEGWKNIELH
jgi:hypothetical protein